MIINPFVFGSGGGGTDPYWSNVVFLSGFNGSDKQTTFTDEKNARAITRLGNAMVSTAQSKFGGSSLWLPRFNCLSDANADEFTIELSFRLDSTGFNQALMGARNGSGVLSSWSILVLGNGAIEFSTHSTSGDSFNASSAGAIVSGTWYDLAVDKDSTGKVRVYKNGVMTHSFTPTNSAQGISNRSIGLGSADGASSQQQNTGLYIDEVRITRGKARYASDSGYTPLGAAFPRNGSDAHWDKVIFISSFDGSNGATSATDDSQYALPISFVSSASLSSTQTRFGATSLRIPNTSSRCSISYGDVLTMADNADWRLSTANSDTFTVEGWVRVDSFQNGIGAIVCQRDSGTGSNIGWCMSVHTNKYIEFFYRTASGTLVTVSSTANTISAKTWHHVAVSKDSGGKIRIFVDGVMTGSSTPADSSMTDSTASLGFGAEANMAQPEYCFKGYIEEVRITKGVCRYPSDSGFTAPTAAFPRS